MDQVNILLVDDHPAKLLAYEVILSELGENLITASSPQEALGVLLKTDVALVLIDVVMPGIDGFELASMIRNHPRFEKLPLIFVSAVHIAETDHLRGYKSGAVDYVAVPVVPEMLRAKVKVFVELYRKTRQLEMLNAELENRVATRTAELEAQTERLRESEERRSIALSAGDMGAWEVDVATGRIEWDEGTYRIFGVDRAQFRPSVENIEKIVHPEDRSRNSLSQIIATGETHFKTEFRIVRPSGEVRHCYGSGLVSRDSAGNAVHMNGVVVDVSDRKRTEERQLLLAREVDHRAKNMLAVVLSVLRLTKARTVREFVGIVEGRIHALAATHNLLSATRWQGANLQKIVDEEMAPYHSSHRSRIDARGPPATLLPATAQAVALALHELATNAAKYGALSTETGHLELVWCLDDEALMLSWTETGGPPVVAPTSLGFGLSIVRSSIEAQFRGGVLYEWRPEGLYCRLSIPRAQIVGTARAEPPSFRTVGNTDVQRRETLAGLRLMVVEDEMLVGMLAKQILESLGATVVGPYGSLSDGLAAAETERFDGALLDVNLAGEFADPLADLLRERGVPFAFTTGYQHDGIDRRFADIPVVAKPLDTETLERVLVSLLEAAINRRDDVGRRGSARR